MAQACKRCSRRIVGLREGLAMSLSHPQYGAGSSLGDGFSVDQMSGLMEILGVRQHEEQDENSKPPSLNPASLTGGKQSQARPNMKVAVKKAVKKDEGAIWKPEEFKAASGVVVKEQGDDRAIPRYEVLPRQKVNASDAYLNLQEMDPSSDRCQELLVKIWLPDTQLKDISLDVLEDRLMLQAPKHRLNLALPHRVKKDSGNAKWDKIAGLLSVVIPVDAKVKYFSKPEEALLD
uniref:PIH1D1/2/3 CS-like domain-containing protein n=1 Tax=Alexandrium monilatum TaxID=311494 RepID=A0A7S4UFS6_9DINO